MSAQIELPAELSGGFCQVMLAIIVWEGGWGGGGRDESSQHRLALLLSAHAPLP